MITKLAEVKASLGIDNDDSNLRIETILPNVELEFLRYTKNLFLNPLVKYQSSSMSFDTNTITDAYAVFETDYFVAGWAYVTGSVHNDGWNEVSDVTETTISTVDTLVTEDSSNFIKIQLARFPNELKLLIADIIGEIIAKEAWELGMKSRSIGSDSKTWADGFSVGLQSRINSYRSLY